MKFREIKEFQFVLFLDMCVHTDKMLLEVQDIVKFTAFSIDICLFLVFSAITTPFLTLVPQNFMTYQILR